MEAATTSSSSLFSFQFHHNHHGRPIASGSRCSILPRRPGVSASLLLSSTFSYSIPKIKPQRKFHRRCPIPITAVFERFTERAIKTIVYAQREAKQLEKDMVFTQHLLLGLITEDGSPKGFLESGVTIEKAREIVKDIWKVELPEEGNSSSISPGSARDTPFSLSTKRVFEAAVEYSKGMGHNYIAPEHIAIALFTVDDGNALKVLERLGVKIDQLATVAVLKLQGEIANDGREPFVPQGKPKLKPFGKTATGKTSDKRQEKSAVSQFCVDLTTRADEGRIDPVIGRDTEVQRVVQILGRKTKNNPILLGEPGVGKTAIAEGLALRIANAEVPIFLWDKKIMSLDVGLLLSGAKERGELESRITNLIHEVKKDVNIILFIDEVHTLVGSGTVGRGGKGGGLDMANLLKPALARGELRCIASTTLDEHRKYFETDKALARRFQPILVNEPSLEDAKTILMGIRSKYEDHHKCRFTTEAVNAAVYLSARYIPDRFLPDKAIDLLDEAGSRARIDAFRKRKQQQINILSKSPAEYWQEIRSVQTFHELVLASNNYSGEVNATNLGDASSTSTENENNLAPELTLDIAPDEIEPVVVGPDEIATVASLWSGVPVKKLTSDEQASLLDLEKNLQKRVIGQDEAVSAISRAIKRSRTGLKDPKRPIAAMFFCGPTGVGKTELTKALAACYFGSDDAMIRLDMSEYMERHTVSKLIGSPPGYIGYDEGGTLTEAIRRRPFTLVLLDEIEKAHPDIFNILLQVFEDGHLTDSQGRRVSFKNTLIVMTSNVGSQAIVEGGKQRRIGFEFMFPDEEPAPDSSHSTTKSLVMQQLKQYFRPELLNRIDEVVVFHALKKTHLRQILDIMLAEVRNTLLSHGISLELSERLLSLVCKHGYDPKYGARPLRRAITLLIEDVISDAMLAGAYQRGDTISMDVDTAGQPFVSNPSDHSMQLSSSASL